MLPWLSASGHASPACARWWALQQDFPEQGEELAVARFLTAHLAGLSSAD
jgi:hypothetical protein